MASARTKEKKEAARTAPRTPYSGGLGLETIGDLSGLLSQPEPSDAVSGPIEIPLDLIDEDPNQPRLADNPGFSVESLEELAATIRLRGVKSPISVRPHPVDAGRYMVNHGARRVRASRLAGKTSIPVFIDLDYVRADQVIENLQRDALTAREVADYIGRELAAGRKKGEIAKAIGKSPAFVSQHVTLLDLPEPIAVVFNNGRCRDVTVINELVTAYKADAKTVEDWLMDDSQELTRNAVKLLREFLDNKHSSDAVPMEAPEDVEGVAPAETTEKQSNLVAPTDDKKMKRAVVQVQLAGRPARLLLNRRPTAFGRAWFQYEDGEEFETRIEEAKLVALIEA